MAAFQAGAVEIFRGMSFSVNGAQFPRNPEKTITRLVSFFLGRRDGGEYRIAQRFAAVEPMFVNLRGKKRLDRFTLRGRRKVDGQWKLNCMAHNIEKLAHHGYAL